MGKFLGVLVLALVGTACQQQVSVSNGAAVTVPMVLVSAHQPTVSAEPRPAVGAASIVPISPDMLALIRRCDFSPLLQTVRRRNDARFGSHAQNGFFGPDHYRIEMAMTDAYQDSKQPTLYHLAGKKRYKDGVASFRGTFRIMQVIRQPKYPAQAIAEAKKVGQAVKDVPNLYSITGDFELHEDANQPGAGIFRGQLAIDWLLKADGSVSLQGQIPQSAAQGGGVKYEGTWTSYRTRQVAPVVWVEDIFAYSASQHILEDLDFGSRLLQFNPKYAKLGWRGYWENNEWWADTPTPASSL